MLSAETTSCASAVTMQQDRSLAVFSTPERPVRRTVFIMILTTASSRLIATTIRTFASADADDLPEVLTDTSRMQS